MSVNEMFEELKELLELNNEQEAKLGKFLALHIGETIEDDFELKYKFLNPDELDALESK